MKFSFALSLMVFAAISYSAANKQPPCAKNTTKTLATTNAATAAMTIKTTHTTTKQATVPAKRICTRCNIYTCAAGEFFLCGGCLLDSGNEQA